MKKIDDKSIDMILADLPYGTTAVVAEKMGRNYIGCDNNQEYCDIAEKRVKNHLLKQT